MEFMPNLTKRDARRIASWWNAKNTIYYHTAELMKHPAHRRARYCVVRRADKTDKENTR